MTSAEYRRDFFELRAAADGGETICVSDDAVRAISSGFFLCPDGILLALDPKAEPLRERFRAELNGVAS